MSERHHAFAAAPLDFLRGTDIPPDPDIMYAINRTATIALPMSSIVCLSTATSLNSTAMSSSNGTRQPAQWLHWTG